MTWPFCSLHRLQEQLRLRLLCLTGVGTGELRLATPDQFHLDWALWIIPPEVVKQPISSFTGAS